MSRALWGGFLVLAALAAGCSSGSGVPFDPVGGRGSVAPGPSTSEKPRGAAPAVPEPLDIDVDEPCRLLATEQLAAIGIADAGTLQDDDGDAECRWHLTTSQLHVVSLSPVATEEDGLSDLYDDRDYQQYFEPTEIDGYPAVYASIIDQRANGNCELWVGVTDELAVEITTHFLEVDPCPVAERVARGMIEHARGRGGR